jgi:4-hydroxybenzoate polyprenyltransferase
MRTMDDTSPAVAGAPRWRVWLEFTRPFTLWPPALGMVSGGVTAWGAAGTRLSGDSTMLIVNIALGALMAAVLNAASNAINQIYDLPLDAINKPNRALPSGRMTIPEAKWVTAVLYVVALCLAAAINWQCFTMAAVAAVLTWAYSAPPFRTKRHALGANLTIAVPRGLMLKVAGWTTVKSFDTTEPWYIGGVFFLFLLGAATTKDFADMKGDAAHGCITLPVRYGVKKAAWMISPFFVIPFLLIPIGVSRQILTGNPVLLHALGAGLALWGCYTVWLLVRRPDELAKTENHPSWTHMYLMMMALQIGFAVAYIF